MFPATTGIVNERYCVIDQCNLQLSNCLTCLNSTHCVLSGCKANYFYLEGDCVDDCPTDYYKSNGACLYIFIY